MLCKLFSITLIVILFAQISGVPVESRVPVLPGSDESITDSSASLSSMEWGSIQDQIALAEYQYTWQENPAAYTAPNRQNGFYSQLDSAGLHLFAGPDREWDWALRLQAWGTVDEMHPLAEVASVTAVEQYVSLKWHPNLEEWFHNTPEGLEHGFTLSAPPCESGADHVILEMVVAGNLLASVTRDSESILFTTPDFLPVLEYGKLAVYDALGARLSANLSLTKHNGSTIIRVAFADQGALYPITIDPLVTSPTAKMTASDGAANDIFGVRIALSGDTLAVSATGADISGKTNQGAVYIFTRNQGGANTWGQVKKITSSDGASFDNFGSSISLQNDTLAVGAPMDDNNSNDRGGVYLFYRNYPSLNSWGQRVKITPPAGDVDAGMYFGSSVALDGSTLFVGAEGAEGGKGCGYLYYIELGGVTTNLIVKLLPGDLMPDDHFGAAAAMFEDLVAVGAPDFGSGTATGKVYLFRRNQISANGWGQIKALTPGATTYGKFGNEIDLDANTLVVGAYFSSDSGNTARGKAFIFERNINGADAWGLAASRTYPAGTDGDYFGSSVAVSNDMVVIGASRIEVAGMISGGAAFVYLRNNDGAGAWGFDAMITASDSLNGDQFGSSVATDGRTIIVGAATANIDGKSAQGSAYAFTRSGNRWLETRSITLNTPDGKFGEVVAIDDDVAAISAPYVDAGSTNEAGRVYLFKRNQGGANTWGLLKTITASDPAAGDHFGASLALRGGHLFVGAPDKNSATGAAYLFSRNQGGSDNWGFVKKFTASDATANTYYGTSVAIDHEIAAVGACYHPGSVYIYYRNVSGADAWGQVKIINGPNDVTSAYIGKSLALQGDLLAIGDPSRYFSGGVVYLHQEHYGGYRDWTLIKQVEASDSYFNARFGESVALDGNVMLVGAPQTNKGVSYDHGAAYVFAITLFNDNVATEVAKLTAPGGGSHDDYFGTSVSLKDQVAVIGAPNVDVGTTTNQGKAYVFKQNFGGANSWGYVTQFTSTTTGTNYYFGKSISLSGDAILAGAPGYSSSNGRAFIFNEFIYTSYLPELLKP
ncbi:MAG TPA: hypothetical protein VIO61_02395 [Anaerolineaceae bacterium]